MSKIEHGCVYLYKSVCIVYGGRCPVCRLGTVQSEDSEVLENLFRRAKQFVQFRDGHAQLREQGLHQRRKLERPIPPQHLRFGNFLLFLFFGAFLLLLFGLQGVCACFRLTSNLSVEVACAPWPPW